MVVFGAALLFFGPEQLPQVARKFGRVTRDLQNTSQAFLREMERAADLSELTRITPPTPWTEETAPPAQIAAPPVSSPADPFISMPELLALPEESEAEPWPYADSDPQERWRALGPPSRPLA
jgi:Sec-independent protein translocase protein TatA